MSIDNIAIDMAEYLLEQRWNTNETSRAVRQTDHPLHVDEDIGGIAAIGHLHQAATLAGTTRPVVAGTHKDSEQGLHVMHTASELNEFFDNLAREENIVAIARALVVKKVRLFVKDVVSSSDDARKQLALAGFGHWLWEHGQTRKDQYSKLVDKFMPEARKIAASLPTDLPTFKEKMCELLEAAANAHIKHLKGVVSQQGYDLPPACDDAENAEKKVATLASAGSREIEAATTIEDAKAEYEKAKTRIAAVKALNSPTFHLRGHTAELPSPAKFAKRTLQLTIKQPEALTIGRVTWLVSITDGAANVTQTRQTTHEIDIDVEIEAEATMEFTSRNICGVSELTLTLTPPAEEAEGT